MGADVLVSLLGALCADRRTTLHSYLLQRPLYRILETPTGTRYNPGGPVIGPAVDKLSKPLIVVIAPPDVMAAAQPAYDACAESVDIAPLGLLCVDWCCDSMAAEAERMQAVISFVCASPTVHGCVIMSPPLQAVAHAAFLARCGSADAVKPACVECECACGDASRPVLATPVPCCPSPSTCCEDVTTVCCVSPHLLADEGANVSVLVKHSDGSVVGCALKDNGDALPAVHTFIEAFKLLHCCTKN